MSIATFHVSNYLFLCVMSRPNNGQCSHYWPYSGASWFSPSECLLPLLLHVPSFKIVYFVNTFIIFFLQHEYGDTTNGCISTGKASGTLFPFFASLFSFLAVVQFN